MLSISYSKHVPHIGSKFQPNQKIRVQMEFISIKIRSKIGNLIDYLLYLGYSQKCIVDTKMADNKIPNKFKLINNKSISYYFENVPEFILAPKELEYGVMPKQNNQFYIGSLLDLSRVDLFESDFFRKTINKIILLKKDLNFKFIYCAFGSMYGEWSSIIIKFLYRLFSALSTMQKVVMICSFGDQQKSINQSKIPNNIFCFERVPQMVALQHADLFITHGGLGSIKESIEFGVPMLAYPITKKWDSNGNSSKIAYHQLGLRGDIQEDSEKIINAKINIIFNEEIFKNNVIKLKKINSENYNEQKFNQIVNQILND